MLEIFNNPWVLFALFLIGGIIGGVWGLKKSKKKGGDAAVDAPQKGMRVQSAVVAVLLATVVAMLFSLPTLSIDIEGIFTYAFDIVNAFMPLIAIVAGLGLGFNLVQKIGSLFQRAL
jgi:hypothetical protein